MKKTSQQPCLYCDPNSNNFHSLNNTQEYSGIDIAISSMGALRCRASYGMEYRCQDVALILYCPMCGRKLK